MPRILVIEDNPTIRKEVLTWLQLEEYDVVGATNGREGVEIGLQQRPDLILADIMLPEKDGYRVLVELRTQPTTALIPFIFMTAKQEKVDIRYGMQLGADDYITKPFERNELLSAVRTRLARRAVLLEEGNRKERDLRSQLLRMIPHELRTPLVGILGIGELLGQDAQSLTPAEITDYAAMITTSGRQLYRLVENHLLYTQLIMDAEDPQWVQMTEDATVHQIIPLIHNVSEEIAQAYKRADHLQMDLQPATVHVTREHLSKIVYELVDNAFKFSKAPASVKVLGQVRVDQYLLTITDQGRGLTPEQTNQIAAYVQFERQKHEQPGVGLGLTLARLLAELYGGGLQLKSTPGIGTAIQVTLRLT